jgi:hypothetical protein
MSTAVAARVTPLKVPPKSLLAATWGSGVKAASAKIRPGPGPASARPVSSSAIERCRRFRAQSMTPTPFGFVWRSPKPVGPG